MSPRLQLTIQPLWTANGGTVASAEPVLLAGLSAGDAYLNIHTTNFTGGEIRGFLHAVPRALYLGHDDPGFAGIGFMAYRRSRKSTMAAA